MATEKRTEEQKKKTKKERTELLELWFNSNEEVRLNISRAYGRTIHNCLKELERIYRDDARGRGDGRAFICFIQERVKCKNQMFLGLLVFMDCALEKGGAFFCGSGMIHCEAQQE